jgi:hypothetical protein
VNNDFIRVDDGDNVHLNNGWQLQAGHTYTLVLDASNGHQSIQISILEDGVAPTAPPSDFPVTINGTPMTMLNFNGDFKADVDLTQNTPVVIGGVEPADLASWWIDPDFIGIDMSQGYPVPYLVPASGKYRIIANINNRSFRAIPLNVEGNPATLQPDGSGTLWIIGHGIGKPNLNANRSNLGAGWVLEDAMAMAPMGNGIFRTTFKAGTEADANTSGITLFAPPANSNPPLFQIKFFFQPGWGGEFRGSNYNIAENQYPIITTSDVVEIVPDGDVVLRTGKTFETGATYTFNVDITGLQQGGTAVLTVTKD